MDGRIPYFKLENGIKMSNDEFREISIQREKEIKKAIFILNSDFSQKTERCSLINKILDASESEEEKAVILAQVLNAMERKILSMLFDSYQDEAEGDEF